MLFRFSATFALFIFLCKESSCKAVRLSDPKCQGCWQCPKHCKIKKIGLLKRLQRKGTIQDFYKPGFHKLKTFDGSNRMKERLCELANDSCISKIFEVPRYQLMISELYELPPNLKPPTIEYLSGVGTMISDRYIAGLNTISTYGSEKSWRIGILMQKCGSYVSYAVMVDTILHELTRCFHENHSIQFYNEWNKLRALYRLYSRERWIKSITKGWKKVKGLLPLIIPVILGSVILSGKVLNREKSRKLSTSKGLPPTIRAVWKKMF